MEYIADIKNGFILDVYCYAHVFPTFRSDSDDSEVKSFSSENPDYVAYEVSIKLVDRNKV